MTDQKPPFAPEAGKVYTATIKKFVKECQGKFSPTFMYFINLGGEKDEVYFATETAHAKLQTVVGQQVKIHKPKGDKATLSVFLGEEEVEGKAKAATGGSAGIGADFLSQINDLAKRVSDLERKVEEHLNIPQNEENLEDVKPLPF